MTGQRPGPLAAARLAAALMVLLTAACVGGLPDSGSISTVPGPDPSEQSVEPFDYNPDGPSFGATPVDVVSGFLLAMQAWPLRTAVAQEFLSPEASDSWAPEKRTVVYGGLSSEGTRGRVSLRLSDTVALDGRGKWLGDRRQGEGIAYDIELVRVDGQWRIDNPPDALVVPRSHFDTRYAQYALYFFDKTARVLVPEMVHLPRGEQTPNLLVRGLLRGPDPDLLGTIRTFLPSDAELDLAVLVAANGTAEVPLSDEVLDLEGDSLDRALGQLAWTLGQVPGVEAMELTVDGSPLDLPGVSTRRSVFDWPQIDPAVSWASQELFGIRDDRVVAVAGDQERRIAGALGSGRLPISLLGVDLSGRRVAAVTADGTTVVEGSRHRRPPGPGPGRVVYAGGTRLLRPVWDLYRQIWLLDRSSDGGEVFVVRSGEAVPVEVPGVSGEDVSAFTVSRDGTRLVAVVSDADGDRLAMARVMRAPDGSVRRVEAATELTLSAHRVLEIRDLAWRTPGSLALLTRPTAARSQVLVTSIDGSSALRDVASNADVFSDAVRILTSPSPVTPLLVGTSRGRLFELAADGRWAGTSIRKGLVSPTFVG